LYSGLPASSSLCRITLLSCLCNGAGHKLWGGNKPTLTLWGNSNNHAGMLQAPWHYPLVQVVIRKPSSLGVRWRRILWCFFGCWQLPAMDFVFSSPLQFWWTLSSWDQILASLRCSILFVGANLCPSHSKFCHARKFTNLWNPLAEPHGGSSMDGMTFSYFEFLWKLDSIFVDQQFFWFSVEIKSKRNFLRDLSAFKHGYPLSCALGPCCHSLSISSSHLFLFIHVQMVFHGQPAILH
jgi:hypothetical protein